MTDTFQPLHQVPPRAFLRALYILDTNVQEEEGGIRIEPLSRGEATLSVVQHTVASRLFNRQLLARHLAFCDAFSAVVPIRRLFYPRRFNYLSRVREALIDDLAVE